MVNAFRKQPYKAFTGPAYPSDDVDWLTATCCWFKMNRQVRG